MVEAEKLVIEKIPQKNVHSERVGVAWTDLVDEWVKWIFQKCSEGLPMSTVQI